jgi:hypothetical protein
VNEDDRQHYLSSFRSGAATVWGLNDISPARSIVDRLIESGSPMLRLGVHRVADVEHSHGFFSAVFAA